MNKFEKFIRIFLFAIIFIGVGYFWRMAHESNSATNAFFAGQKALIRDISREIPKGYIFHIEGIKFIPRKDKRSVNISFAGAGDEGIRKVYEKQ